jgi:hypothetical protein
MEQESLELREPPSPGKTPQIEEKEAIEIYTGLSGHKQGLTQRATDLDQGQWQW